VGRTEASALRAFQTLPLRTGYFSGTFIFSEARASGPAIGSNGPAHHVQPPGHCRASSRQLEQEPLHPGLNALSNDSDHVDEPRGLLWCSGRQSIAEREHVTNAIGRRRKKHVAPLELRNDVGEMCCVARCLLDFGSPCIERIEDLLDRLSVGGVDVDRSAAAQGGYEHAGDR